MTTQNSPLIVLTNSTSRRNRGRERANRRVSLLLRRTKRLLEIEREKAHHFHGAEHEENSNELREMRRLYRTFRLLSDSMRESESHRNQDLSAHLCGALQPLQSPLTRSASAARQLLGQDGSEDERKRWLDLVIQGLSEMETVLTELLGQSSQNVKPTHRSEVLDFVTLASDALTERGSVALSKVRNISFRGDPQGECLVMGDKALLQRLVLNLLASLVSCDEINCDLRICVWRHDSQVIFMAESCDFRADSVQEPYYPFVRLDEVPAFVERREAALASIKHLADAHDAEVSVRSVNGQETAFIIKFGAHQV